MADTDSVVITGPIRVEDTMRALRFKYRALFLTYRIVGLVFLAIGSLMNFYTGERDLVVPLLGLFALSLPSIQLMRFKRILSNTPSMYGDHVLTFSAAGFHARSSQIESQQPWSFFTSFKESDDDFLMLSGKAMFQAAPKHLFTDEDQIQRVRSLLAEHIPVKNRKEK